MIQISRQEVGFQNFPKFVNFDKIDLMLIHAKKSDKTLAYIFITIHEWPFCAQTTRSDARLVWSNAIPKLNINNSVFCDRTSTPMYKFEMTI